MVRHQLKLNSGSLPLSVLQILCWLVKNCVQLPLFRFERFVKVQSKSACDMLSGCLNGAYWIFFKLSHEPHHAGFCECRNAPSIVIVCMHLHVFNLNIWGSLQLQNMYSFSTSLVLERFFTFGQSLQPWACDAFKATKPVEPGIAHWEFSLCWQKPSSTHSLQNPVKNQKDHTYSS